MSLPPPHGERCILTSHAPGASRAAVYSPRMLEPGMYSLAPVAVTLAIALVLRNVLAGLFAGVLTGAAMLTDASPLHFLPELVGGWLVPEVADGYNASILVLLAFIGGFVKLIETSGGGMAFARSAMRWVKGPVRAQVAAWCGGIMIFFSDLGTPLIVGPVFQSLMDRLRVSRQKLAFILDSTSSPVCILIPFIGWGVFIMSVLADAFAANSVEVGEWDAFVSAIPYQFYAWLAIAIVPLLALMRFDYGPMRAAEREAGCATPAEHVQVETHGRARPVLVWLPLLVLMPEKMMSDLVRVQMISRRVTLNSARTPNSSSFSSNSGMTDISALVSV